MFRKRLTCAAIALGCGVLMSRPVCAAYTNLSISSFNTTVALNPGDPTVLTPVTIHRLWANFTNPNDALYAWGGGGGLGSAVINNFTPGLPTQFFPGSGFLNNTAGGDLPSNSNPALAISDTYFTIGVTLQNQIPTGQGISLMPIPGTPSGLTGNSINLSGGGGIETSPTTSSGAPNPISLAGFTGDGDTALRVLLMQLVVHQGEVVGGTIGITINLGGLAGATTTLQNQHFGIPAPASLALLGAAGLLMNRRRRT